MRQLLRKLLRILPILVVFSSQAQTRLENIKPNCIEQKTIRKFLKRNIENGIANFDDFSPSVTAGTDTGQFDFSSLNFHLQTNLEIVWKTYLTAHPAKIWQSENVNFGFIYSTQRRCIILKNDNYPGLETGQIFFLEMRILLGLFKFPVCFTVTKIDQTKRTISFSYVISSSSKGSQTISFVDDGKDGTKIFHSSLHQTKNRLRDKTLYPIYHRRAIKTIHHNIEKILLPKQNCN